MPNIALICHACGRLHARPAGTVHPALQLVVHTDDGEEIVMPVAACADCLRRPEVVRAAWERGMSLAARERAVTDVKRWAGSNLAQAV